MKKNTFIKSSIILIIGGLITKILGMIIKIITTRMLTTEAIGLYMLITPTYMLLISICTLGFQGAISKLVSEDKYNNRKLLLSLIPVTIVFNILIMLIVIFSSKYITFTLLKEKRVFYAIISMSFVLPFVAVSSLLRGYFFGKQKMIPHVISIIIEDIIRLIIIIIGIPIFLKKRIEYIVCFLVLSNIFSELTSIIILILFLPNKKLNKKDFLPNKKYYKKIFNISIPITISRLIGNIGYFFEPIILTNVLLKIGYTNKYIVNEYGIITGYVLPLLLLPSFFTMAISQALIPVVSKAYTNKNIKYTTKKIKQAIYLSLLIGIPVTIFFELFPSFSLNTLYHTTLGVNYLRVLAPICLLQYIQSPLTSSLQAIDKAKDAMNGTIIGMLSRTILLFTLSFLKIGLWSLIISTSISIILVTYHQYKVLKKHIKNSN